MGGIGPRPDHGKPVLKAGDVRDIRLEVVEPPCHGGIAETGIGVGQRLGQAENETAMAFMAGFAKVRQAGKIPETAHLALAAHLRPDGLILCHPAQNPFIQRVRVLAQYRAARGAGETGDQRLDRAVIEVRVTPLKLIDRLEIIRFDGADEVFLERRAVACLAELTIGAKTARPPRYLSGFGG